MKKLLFVLPFVALMGCEKEKVQEYEPLPQPQFSVINYEETISNSIYMDYYNHFLSAELGTLNSSANTYSIEGNTLYAFHSNVKHSQNDNWPKANLLAIPAPNGNISTVVYDYSNLVVVDGAASSGHISIRLVNGLELYKINKNDQGKWVMVDGDDLELIPTQGINGWWSCVAHCYSFAKNACAGDPHCDILCDLVNVVTSLCNIEIGVACAAHCTINGGTFNPPTAIYALNQLDPYGFGQ
jgi:hypothetical protein